MVYIVSLLSSPFAIGQDKRDKLASLVFMVVAAHHAQRRLLSARLSASTPPCEGNDKQIMTKFSPNPVELTNFYTLYYSSTRYTSSESKHFDLQKLECIRKDTMLENNPRHLALQLCEPALLGPNFKVVWDRPRENKT